MRRVFLIGETTLIEDGLKEFLETIGIPDWDSDAPTDSEKLIELMGRLCYFSFKPFDPELAQNPNVRLNPNVTRIRTGNRVYIENLLRSKHGSVLEHAYLNFIIIASRVFTHELVRHRVGTAFSQESQRFVRLSVVDYGYLPLCIVENDEAMKIFIEVQEFIQGKYEELLKVLNIDQASSFEIKKILTSAARRILPNGIKTYIGFSCNLRALRWILETRTNPAAEEEMRSIFAEMGDIVVSRYPNVFQDFEFEIVNGIKWWKPKYSKV